MLLVVGQFSALAKQTPVSSTQVTAGQTVYGGSFYKTPITDYYLTDTTKSITVDAAVTGKVSLRRDTTWFSAPPANTFFSGFTTANTLPGGAMDVDASGCTVSTTAVTTCANVGTFTLTFSKPVTNPVVYLSGIGNQYSGSGRTTTAGTGNFGVASRFNLTSALNGASSAGFTLGLVGTPTNMTVAGSQIRVTNVVIGSSCTTAPIVGCGAVRVTGTFTQLTFSVDMQTVSAAGGPSGTITSYTGDGITYAVSVDEDYGDAPASYDQTAAAHVVGSLKLGAGITPDNVNTQNTGSIAASPLAGSTATGDTDDGVTMPATVRQGSTYSIPVSVNGTGLLSAWFDWNRNGVFDPSEQVTAGQAVTTGTTNLSVTVPSGASLGTSYARFRLTTLSNLPANGPAPDGEVEDYAFTISTPLLTLGTPVTMNQCPATPVRVQGTLAGWFNNWPGETLTQDGYYNQSWNQLSWVNNGIGADTQRLTGQGSSQSFGPGISQSNAPLSTLRNLKPTSGTWAAEAPTLNDAIGKGLYVQVSVTTNSSYEASRMVLWGAQNFNTFGGSWKSAMYISTSPTFSTQTEIYRDVTFGTQETIGTVRPILAKGTTYYVRLYFYAVTATTSGDGSIAWDDWNLLSGYCSSVNPTGDTGTAASGTASTAVTNIVANDTVNGNAAVLGSGGNANVAVAGTWPSGITLDAATGAVLVDATVGGGVYTLSYQLCDAGTPPVCSTGTITLSVTSQLQIRKMSTVISDPVRGTTNPLAIPGATMRYCIVVTNDAGNQTVETATINDDMSALNVDYIVPSLRVDGSFDGSVCDFTTGTAGGSYAAGIVTATLTNILAGTSRTIWFDVLIH